MHPESRIDTMQNIKFKTCIIDGQERYAFATIDENGQMTEMPAQMFPESLLSFMDIDMSRVSELFSAMNDCIISLPDIADTKYLDKLLLLRLRWLNRMLCSPCSQCSVFLQSIIIFRPLARIFLAAGFLG